MGDNTGRHHGGQSAAIETTSPSAVSVMPEGLDLALGPDRFRDLLTFLLTDPQDPAPIEHDGAPPPRRRAELDAVLKGVSRVDKPKPLRIVLAAGPKDHGPGEHDYPLWLKRWSQPACDRPISKCRDCERLASGQPARNGERDRLLLEQSLTVAVLPEAEEVDIKIEAKDIRIDTFCSSGPGGQSVNTTYSAVRITHIPTNTVVSCQDEKSQIKNREKGMRVLRSRLYEMEMERQNAELARERKQQVGTGDRSEKIRTYNFPQNRLTDHRIGLTLHQLDLVMEGRLQPIVDALVAHYQAEQLKADNQAA